MYDRLKLLLLNLYFYSLFILCSAIVIPVLTIVALSARPFISHRRFMKLFRRFISMYGKMVMALPFPFIRVSYEQPANSDPGEPYIFVANHRSASDAFLMGVLQHEAIQIVNIWPFKIPVLGPYARLSGYLNIRMMHPDQFTRKATELLREGVSIIFFPEGTRSVGKQMGSFHGAAFRLAQGTKASLVPLCITGSERVPPKGSLALRPGKIRIRRLPAIQWDDYKDLTVFALKNRVWKLMDRELSFMESGS